MAPGQTVTKVEPMRTRETPESGAQDTRHVFAEGAAALHIDGAGMVVGIDPLDGTKLDPTSISPIPLKELLLAESVEPALDDVRQVLATGTARFVSWEVVENGTSRLHAGWLYPEGEHVVGVLRCFEHPD
jgi:hypothetical protein